MTTGAGASVASAIEVLRKPNCGISCGDGRYTNSHLLDDKEAAALLAYIESWEKGCTGKHGSQAPCVTP